VKVQQSEVVEVGSCFEQELNWTQGKKTRREIFVGRSREELDRMVTERRAELKREQS
jgi:hypothetical protein